MSAASGAPPPPNPPPGGGPSKTPSDRDDDDDKPWPNDKKHNRHNDWAKNTTVKTCKCKLCDQRVKKYSWKCSHCSRHLCNECAEEDGASRPKDKYIAADFLKNVDGCFYPSGQPPYLHAELERRGLLSLPQKRPEVIMRDMNIKAEIKRKKELKAKTQADDEESKSKRRRLGGIRNDLESPTPGPSQNANGTYEGNVNAEPTIASSKAPRKSAPRQSYGEQSSDEAWSEKEQPGQRRRQTKSASTTQLLTRPSQAQPNANDSPVSQVQPPCAHLDRGDTVIIGAGIVGLCIARELAMKAAETKTRHTINVLEIREGPGELASGSCSGLLSVHNIPKPMNELSELANECWIELVQTPGFIEATDFRQDCVYQVARLDGKGRKHKPSWYIGHDLDSFRDDKWTVGKLDTKKLSAWLYQECLSYGVNFVFHHEISAVLSAPDKDVSSVAIRDCHNREKARETIRCQNIVFAAGPWTTELFTHMYSKSSLKLENHVRLAYWYCLQSPSMSDREDVGLLFPDLADADEALEDMITMVGHSANENVVVTGVGSKSKNTELNAVEALDPQLNDTQPLRHLKRIAAKRLDGDGQDVFRVDNAARGFHFVSTSDQQLPTIDKVPTSLLGTVGTGGDDERRCGIWLCFGFGMYGTTLAPGAARVLCRRMFGEGSKIKDHNFKISTGAQPAAEQADKKQ